MKYLFYFTVSLFLIFSCSSESEEEIIIPPSINNVSISEGIEGDVIEIVVADLNEERVNSVLFGNTPSPEINVNNNIVSATVPSGLRGQEVEVIVNIAREGQDDLTLVAINSFSILPLVFDSFRQSLITLGDTLYLEGANFNTDTSRYSLSLSNPSTTASLGIEAEMLIVNIEDDLMKIIPGRDFSRLSLFEESQLTVSLDDIDFTVEEQVIITRSFFITPSNSLIEGIGTAPGSTFSIITNPGGQVFQDINIGDEVINSFGSLRTTTADGISGRFYNYRAPTNLMVGNEVNIEISQNGIEFLPANDTANLLRIIDGQFDFEPKQVVNQTSVQVILSLNRVYFPNDFRVDLFNVSTGQEIEIPTRGTTDGSFLNYMLTIDISGFESPSGLYVLRVTTADGEYSFLPVSENIIEFRTE